LQAGRRVSYGDCNCQAPATQGGTRTEVQKISQCLTRRIVNSTMAGRTVAPSYRRRASKCAPVELLNGSHSGGQAIVVNVFEALPTATVTILLQGRASSAALRTALHVTTDTSTIPARGTLARQPLSFPLRPQLRVSLACPGVVSLAGRDWPARGTKRRSEGIPVRHSGRICGLVAARRLHDARPADMRGSDGLPAPAANLRVVVAEKVVWMDSAGGEHHHDLHPRPEPRGLRRSQPAGPLMVGRTCAGSYRGVRQMRAVYSTGTAAASLEGAEGRPARSHASFD
jgi:hypothetical protein